MYNFLFINEDGSMIKGNTISNTDIYAVELGVLDIIKIDRGDPMVLLTNGKWEKIDAK